jgi:hypothetical protein
LRYANISPVLYLALVVVPVFTSTSVLQEYSIDSHVSEPLIFLFLFFFVEAGRTRMSSLINKVAASFTFGAGPDTI